ncbi:MAG: hypothetical protein VYC11_02210 [Candidatus Thermoplasmatota archaeon]|mgnify:CR=1 FL=1|nr:hypothetical protein [Candidatus Thermoplasmatota archaeon]
MAKITDPRVVALIALVLVSQIPVTESPSISADNQSPCNGSVENCDKEYTNVTFPETHNAHSSLDEGFIVQSANHRLNLSQQWDAGFRAFMLDIHHSKFSNSSENASFCHGSYDIGFHPCAYGSINAIELLSTIHEKMNSTPNDVVTLLLEVYVPYSHISFVLNASGLIEHSHVQTLGQSWPTLQEMVDAEKNLVVFIEGSADSDYPFLHDFTEHGWTTSYGLGKIADMTCDVFRGDSAQPVWHMNNWLSNEQTGLSDYARAPIVNHYDFLINRSIDCWEQHGVRPTFIAVDWWTDGSAVEVSHALNRMDHWSDEVPLLETTDSR